jgi:hypothetical protein
MQDFITVAIFVFPSQMVIAKSKLESEGIVCKVLDELTVQSYNFISNAVGGVKLQVLRSDFERSRSILLEGGFITSVETKSSFIEQKLSNPTTRKRIGRALNVFLVLVLILSVVLLVYAHKTAPTTYQKFASGEWCLDHIVYSNQEYRPATYEFKNDTGSHGVIILQQDLWCDERIVFKQDGTVDIPGFNTPRIAGKWRFYGDSLYISNIDTLDDVFENNYHVVFENKLMVLKSDYTYLVCYDTK